MTPERAPAPASFTRDRGPAADATVIVHDTAAPGADLTRLLDILTPAARAAVAALDANDPPLEIGFPGGLAVRRLVIWPAGELAAGEAQRRALGGRIAAHLRARPALDAKLIVSSGRAADADTWAMQIAYGAVLRGYAFPGYATKADSKPRYPQSYAVATADPDASERAFLPYRERAASVHLTRDLAAEPSNLLTPTAFAERIRQLAATGLKIEILDRPALEALGMGALLAVARGSAQPPFVAVMQWQGASDSAAPPLALVGKGVMFDSGGVNLKPAAFMLRMKADMSGAASVVGAMRSLAARKAPVNVVGIVGLVENMPSGDAYKPSDVLTTMSGKTVEVVDTDNEGRLVLCDLLTFAERRYAPRAIVDIATLTGGARMALGAVYTPLFSNDESLARALTEAGQPEGERLWRMPTGPDYDAMIASPVADMTNGRNDIQAHCVVAARFLERFVERTPWAHLDIGATWISETDLDTAPAGWTGYGTALLDRFAGSPPR